MITIYIYIHIYITEEENKIIHKDTHGCILKINYTLCMLSMNSLIIRGLHRGYV